MERKYDYSLLENRMREMRYSQSQLAKDVPMSRTALNIKLNGHNGFTQKEIKRIAELLHITPTEIGSYFFKLNVQKTVHS
ncbi:DUF739 family protein [Ligilactobacillus sp. 110_WCHN]|uniref:DUF739 family protein n=1 Tax=Ligilactobacillus sp. 110_WCHN TaxID=3057125 RepID=UPI0026715FE4|nr:DUF739 family protein [Ligilactobacillus sp. 110_WCHN]MDO3393922.1 DUF739 family protein [Ligilactobacillus sp. 110_WCHN]